MALEIIDRGTIFMGREGTDASSIIFPVVTVLPSGRWLAGFRAAPIKFENDGQHGLITWSDDEGKSWREPFDPFPPQTIDGKYGLIRLPAPTAMGGSRVLATLCWVYQPVPSQIYFNETEGLLDTRVLFSWSEDNGETWSAPELVDTSPFHVPIPLTGPVLKLRDDVLALQFELNKDYDDTSEWEHHSVLMFSEDGGKNWPRYVYTSEHPQNAVFYWDQRPSLLPDGRLLDLFWSLDRVTNQYINIQARESLDNGATWSAIWDTGVPGQPGPAFMLPDGKVGMVYIDRTATPTIKVRTSADNGRTWPDETELIIHVAEKPKRNWDKGSMQDAWSEMYEFSAGHPSSVMLPDGDILISYYAGPRTDLTGAHWARLRMI